MLAAPAGYTCIVPVPEFNGGGGGGGGGGGLLAMGTADGCLRFADVGAERLLGKGCTIHESNAVFTLCLKAPGFPNPCSSQVILLLGFFKICFKIIILYRYSSDLGGALPCRARLRGLCGRWGSGWNPVDP